MNHGSHFFVRLQGRMEQMRRFRRQHEQLRAVIMRVLGPNLQALSAAGGASGDGDRGEVSDMVSHRGTVMNQRRLILPSL